MDTETSVRIHRFREAVAFHTTTTPTIYLTAAMARQMGEELLRYAADIGAVKFTASTLGTITVHGGS